MARGAGHHATRAGQLAPHSWFGSEQVLVLNSGAELTVGRAFRNGLDELLQKRLRQ